MKKSVKTAWVKALRSGKYKQGAQCLETADGSFCCLGVLATLVDPKRKTWRPEVAIFGDESCQADLIGGQIDRKLINKLTGFNDGLDGIPPKSFKWIASYIERYL